MRKTYISNIELQEAKKLYDDQLKLKRQVIRVKASEALGLVTAKPVFAKISSPHYNASAMDGISVRYEDTQEAREIAPVHLKKDKDFAYVNTGNPVAAEYNAVIMIEDVVQLDKGDVQLIKSASPWQHIRQIGEDIIVGDLIVPSNHLVRAIDIGAMLSGGVSDIICYKEPLIGILPTGNEIVKSSKDIVKGEIIDSNSWMIKGLVEENGGRARVYDPTNDDFESLKKAIKQAIVDHDIVIVNAGSSAGTKDFTVHVIEELGQVIVHGVAIKPGKPTILGMIEGKPIIGLPGYPVSAYFAFNHFVKPMVRYLHGLKIEYLPMIDAYLSRRVVSSFKHQEKVRVTLGYINGKYIATPLNRGAGVTMSLVKADGVLTVDKNVEGIESGEIVSVELVKKPEEIKSTLLSIGSHDLMMDIIADQIPLSSAHVGSMGGIMAMRRGECHIAPIHLLDDKDGSYNLSYVTKYFKGKSMALIKGAKRLQGLMVAPGNPNRIEGFKDLNTGLRYVNRQKGAGTRMLLDYELKQRSIDIKSIKGYERELPTHLSVAIAIKEGTADVGLGIMSAAVAMDLEFIPVGYEEYDFLLQASLLEDPKVKAFIDTIQSQDFKNKLKEIGGYETDHIGEVIKII